MRLSSFTMALLCAAISATPAIAPAQQATPVPVLKGDFSSMRFMLGTWHCKTTKMTNGRGSGRTETDVNTMSALGPYMETKSVSKPFDKARTRDYVGDGWMAYDTVKHQWYSFGLSNFGGFGMQTSPGWTGNTMTWTDFYNSDTTDHGKSIVTKVSDTETTSVTTITTAKGTQTISDMCVKA
jgi:hypothetical protein